MAKNVRERVDVRVRAPRLRLGTWAHGAPETESSDTLALPGACIYNCVVPMVSRDGTSGVTCMYVLPNSLCHPG
jgi:hypothetical protein